MNRPLHIFLAEDNSGDINLIRLALQEHKVENELSVAADGATAKRFIDHLGKDPAVPLPDCILLDLNLPDSSGFELLARFRQHPACAQTPIILISSSNSELDRQRANALGVTAYFRKPSDLDEFMTLGSLILAVMQKRESAA